MKEPIKEAVTMTIYAKEWLKNRERDWLVASQESIHSHDGHTQAYLVEMSGIAHNLEQLANAHTRFSDSQAEGLTDHIRVLAKQYGELTIPERAVKILPLATFVNSCRA